MKKSILVITMAVATFTSCKKDKKSDPEPTPVTPKSAISIGASYQGGKIAYILVSGDPGYSASVKHGLIAATSDQSTGDTWYNGTYSYTGATATAIGSGNANTNTIVASQGAGTYAAKICSDLVLNGYSDWYLPSAKELEKLYINRAAIGGFDNASNYWSSSEYDNIDAWGLGFYDGSLDYGHGKIGDYNVRAVRSF